MIEIYSPMQPSSKTPRIAHLSRSADATPAAILSTSPGTQNSEIECTWLASCSMGSPAHHCFSFARNQSSSKFLLQSVLYGTPALVRHAFRLRRPTNPGHSQI